jgi:hypothetical protein
MELEGRRADLDAALSKADAAEQRARTAEAVKGELERQIEGLRAELRNEVVARAAASAQVEELGDRLASASEEASGLRRKVSQLDKQTKQLREALQGRVRALTTSEWHRRRELEEAEEMRVKLRDVYEKIERSSSLPPSAGRVGAASAPPSSGSMAPSVSSPGMPPVPRSMQPSNDEHSALLSEVARLAAENRQLRARVLGSVPPKKSASRGSVPDLDLDLYRELIKRASTIIGLEGAVIADEVGSVVVGSGDLAEGLAAFGAYIRDASSRTERLLPLEGVEEVDIRDRGGMLLSTRVVLQSPAELSLVLFGRADASIATAKKLAEEKLRLRPL